MDKWLNEAIVAADLQCKRLQESGNYIFAGFEDDRFSSLVHNSLANCALIDLANILKNRGEVNKSNKYINIVSCNVNNYIIKELWDESFGAFKFSKKDYYSLNATRFVVNMNSVAVESLIKLYQFTNEPKYREYALRVGKWILTQQIQDDRELEYGGINYSQVQPRVLISIYTALAMRGLDDLFNLTGNPCYLDMMRKAARHLIKLIDPETDFFYHGVIDGNLRKYPQFVAGSGIILKALDDAEQFTGEKYDYHASLKKILELQNDNGGFQNFIQYYDKKDKGKSVWEDIAPNTAWNAHLFEFLTRKISSDFRIYPRSYKNLLIFNHNYIFIESKRFVSILGFKPIRSIIVYFAVKRWPFSLIYLSTNQIEKHINPKFFRIFKKYKHLFLLSIIIFYILAS
jgi:hypothetical protein